MLENSQAVAEKFVKDYGWTGPVFAISAMTGVGCKELTYAIMAHIDEAKKMSQEESSSNASAT